MPKPKNFLVLLVFPLCLHFEAYASQWFCKEGASSKTNNTYEVCGIGEEMTENESRKTALKNAFEEFDLVCNKSDDCTDKYKQISPLRTDCSEVDNKYKCYRSFYVHVDPTRTSNQAKIEFLSNELEMKEKILESPTYLIQNKDLIERITDVEKLSHEIRENIKSKNQIVESYLKRGMNLKEVFKILNTNMTVDKYTSLNGDSNAEKYTSLNGDDYFIYGTYKIQFNTLLENTPILVAACDMNYSSRCVNLEP